MVGVALQLLKSIFAGQRTGQVWRVCGEQMSSRSVNRDSTTSPSKELNCLSCRRDLLREIFQNRS